MPIHAVDEYELANCPEDRFDRLLFYVALVVEKRDMWGELLVHQMPQAFSHHRCAKRLPKQPQPAQPIAAKQDKRMTVRPAPKARNAVERNLERRHEHFLCRLTCHPENTLNRTTSAVEKKQRDVKTIRSDQRTIEEACAFDHFRHAVDPRGRIGIRLGSEK